MGDFGWRKPNNPYLYTMFVRKKTNRSGTVSVVVVSKAHGKFTEVKKFGVAKSEEEADEMFRKAQLWLQTHGGQQELDFDDRKGKEVEETERFYYAFNAIYRIFSVVAVYFQDNLLNTWSVHIQFWLLYLRAANIKAKAVIRKDKNLLQSISISIVFTMWAAVTSAHEYYN